MISSYSRHIKYINEVGEITKSHKFPVARVQHVVLRTTYSFLPSFAVPYKHYCSDVIYETVEYAYTSSTTVYEASKNFKLPYNTVKNWVLDIKNNLPVHLTEGLLRLEVSPLKIDDPHSLMQYYSEAYCCKSGLDEYNFHIYELIQVKFTESQPSIGFFRPLLV